MKPKKLAIKVMNDAMANILRQKTAFEKLMHCWADLAVRGGVLRGIICTQHLDWDGDQINREIAMQISNGVMKE